MCIPFTMSGVIIGSVVYLSHLGKQTQFNIKRIVSGEKFDMMAPFFAVPYFYMIYEIGYATFNTGLESLHAFEGKMIIVLLYPFYLALGELTSQIGKLKSDSEIKPKQ